jgi:hypothetical protein
MFYSPQIDGTFNAVEFLTGADADDFGKILVVAFHEWPTPVGVFCEIVNSLSQSKDNLCVGLWANQSLVADTSNIYSPRLLKILRQKSVQDQAKEILIKRNKNLKFLDLDSRSKAKRYFFPVKKNRRITELQESLEIPIGKGYAISASIINATQITESFGSISSRLFNEFSASYDFVFLKSTELLVNEKIQTVLIYNGRFMHEHALKAAAEHLSLQVIYYEEGGIDSGFDIYKHGTHDRKALQVRMVSSYQVIDENNKASFAAGWFNDRRNRNDSEVNKFSKHQEIGKRLDLDIGKKVVVFFSSSSDEVASIGQEWNSNFGNQESALLNLHKAILSLGDYVLVVRTHPNMMNKKRRNRTAWNRFIRSLPDVIHIKAESPIDSYQIMEQADRVVVFGSTIGIESAFAGKATASLSPSFYDELGAVKTLSSFEEIKDWFDDPKDLPNPNVAMPYGFFNRSRGLSYSKFNPIDERLGYFESEIIGVERPFIRFLLALENYIRRRTW